MDTAQTPAAPAPETPPVETKAAPYALDKPPIEYVVEPTDDLFTVGETLYLPAFRVMFTRATGARVNGKVQRIEAKEEHTKATIKMTHAQALGLEQSGYIVTPSPIEAIRADFAAKEAARVKVEAEAAAKIAADAAEAAAKAKADETKAGSKPSTKS